MLQKFTLSLLAKFRNYISSINVKSDTAYKWKEQKYFYSMHHNAKAVLQQVILVQLLPCDYHLLPPQRFILQPMGL